MTAARPSPAASGPHQDVVVAIDVGGTGIKAGLVAADGTVRQEHRYPTAANRGPAAVVDTIGDLAEGLVGKAHADGLRPRAVGLVVPGIVDEAAGVAVWSANVGFRDVPLRDILADRLGLPTVLGHDVRAGGLAEARLGAARGSRHVLFVAIGTGIAAAYVADGVALAGAHGGAGELGHVIVVPGGPQCGCGGHGCLESVASAAAVARRYAARPRDLTDDSRDDPRDRTENPPSEGHDPRDFTENARRTEAGAASAADVARLAAGGDAVAAAVWRETVDWLADGLLTGLALFDPEIVVVGGGLAEAGEHLLGPLRSALRARLTFHREPRLVRAALGDAAGCLGAGLLALDLAKRSTAAANEGRAA